MVVMLPVTVSVKIPEELRKKMRDLDIAPSRVLRLAIEEEVKRREAERLEGEIEKLRPLLESMSVKEAVKSIQEDRRQR